MRWVRFVPAYARCVHAMPGVRAVRPFGRPRRRAHADEQEGGRDRDDAVRRWQRQRQRRPARAATAGRLHPRRVSADQERNAAGANGRPAAAVVPDEFGRRVHLQDVGREDGQTVQVPGDPAGELAGHRPAGHVAEAAQVHQAADVHAGRAQAGLVDHVHHEGASGRGCQLGAPGQVVRQGPGTVGRVVRPTVYAAGDVRPMPDGVLRPPGPDRRVTQIAEADDGRAGLQAAKRGRYDEPGRRDGVVDEFRHAAVPELCGADSKEQVGKRRRRVSGRVGHDQRQGRVPYRPCSGTRRDVQNQRDEFGAKHH